ncbi:hypothetical protein CDD82_6474 [Ophiocordyceps australis]|uniref:non-specific serine/threonine protein kinase n=1 Tax=Ophiocordyceps australis TaxID=1399860 RepID=A0A2C5ZS86_9HYPO|nr:hypothetical protein CDD82_6474 [Ophiocordyceps australis]
MPSQDKYDTLEKIGHGSFGIIRKVRRKVDGFIMCRKEISYLRMSQKEREQLHAEFQILSHLRHPNIVAYYHREHLKISQDLHLYMEYCGNGDLGRVIKDLQLRGHRAQESFVWGIFGQLVMALYRCHYGVDPPQLDDGVYAPGNASAPPKVPAGAVTILHRDLKPENVFLGEDNSVKLGDFGLSKMIQTHDFASTYVGTPFYMSPEICAGERYTLKSDIWSLGCIVFELCAREPPFNAKTHVQLVHKIKEAKVPPLPDMYSVELGQVIRDCLRVNPERRTDTAQLLNLPMIRLMRREQEMRDSTRASLEAVRTKQRELDESLKQLQMQRKTLHQELDSSLRREWEVKARLEIDRQADAEREHLNKRFEEEVHARVGAEVRVQVEAKTRAVAAEMRQRIEADVWARAETEMRLSLEPDLWARVEAELHRARRSSGVADCDLGLSATRPSTVCESGENSDCALDKAPPKENTMHTTRTGPRTPMRRAQTMILGTPMDIDTVSPKPLAIANLALSPRRNAACKPPRTCADNIFAVANRQASGDVGDAQQLWNRGRELPLSDSDSDDDDDDSFVPSPTRHLTSSKNPLVPRDRPLLLSQKSCPVRHAKSAKASSSDTAPAFESASRSPRPLSKIPSVATLQPDAPLASAAPTAPAGGPFARKLHNSSSSSEPLAKLVAKNTIRGRTLVELQQARAGGRSLAAAADKTSPCRRQPNPSPCRRAAAATAPPALPAARPARRLSGSASSGSASEGPAVWDPDKDEMPSPFLSRHKRITKD